MEQAREIRGMFLPLTLRNHVFPLLDPFALVFQKS